MLPPEGAVPSGLSSGIADLSDSGSNLANSDEESVDGPSPTSTPLPSGNSPSGDDPVVGDGNQPSPTSVAAPPVNGPSGSTPGVVPGFTPGVVAGFTPGISQGGAPQPGEPGAAPRPGM